MSYTLINDETPWPLLRAAPGHRPSDFDPATRDITHAITQAYDSDFLLFRGVSIDRHHAVVANGVDVSPTDSPIFCSDDISKAFEYTQTPIGGHAGAIMAFRSSQLKPSWQTLDSSADNAIIEKTLIDYPHQADHGNELWFSRIPNSQPYNSYEFEYGYWIPGDAHAALAAVILVGDVHLPFDWSPPGERAQKWTPPQHWIGSSL